MSDLERWGDSARDRRELDDFITREPDDPEEGDQAAETETLPQPAMLRGAMLSWASQAKQYPPKWYHPGLVHLRPDAKGRFMAADDPRPTTIECLLLYSSSRQLVGILNYYPVDSPPWERAGNANLWVKPSQQRRGIGTRLLREANRRWSIDPLSQRYTREGYALAKSIWPSLPEPAEAPETAVTTEPSA